MSDFAENLRNAMFKKRCKAVDVSRTTKITPSVISRNLSGTHQPSTITLIAISKYLRVSPEALLSSSDAPESIKMSTSVSVDKNTIIEVQRELIERLKKDVGRLEAVLKKTKNPTKPNKQKVGFMKKHKKPKS